MLKLILIKSMRVNNVQLNFITFFELTPINNHTFIQQSSLKSICNSSVTYF